LRSHFNAPTWKISSSTARWMNFAFRAALERLGRFHHLLRLDGDHRLTAARPFLRLNARRVVGFADRGLAAVPQLFQGLEMLAHRAANLRDDGLMLFRRGLFQLGRLHALGAERRRGLTGSFRNGPGFLPGDELLRSIVSLDDETSVRRFEIFNAVARRDAFMRLVPLRSGQDLRAAANRRRDDVRAFGVRPVGRAAFRRNDADPICETGWPVAPLVAHFLNSATESNCTTDLPPVQPFS
jgi:hypothetical protein